MRATVDQTTSLGAPWTLVEVTNVHENLATVREPTGVQHTVRTDVLRYKGHPPSPGETWFIDRYLGFYSFVAIVDSDWTHRRKATYFTRELAAGAIEQGEIKLALGFRILHIATDKPSRTRLYATKADQTFDLTRDVSTIPDPKTGIIMDFLTVAQMLSAPLSPIPEGASLEDTPSVLIPISVTSVAGGPVAVTLTWVRTE
jgi:hypothetical protein